MAAQTMTEPEEIDTVFFIGPVAAIHLDTLVSDKLLEWNYELNDIKKALSWSNIMICPTLGWGMLLTTRLSSLGWINEGGICLHRHWSQSG